MALRSMLDEVSTRRAARRVEVQLTGKVEP
jgi:hypothetical protein